MTLRKRVWVAPVTLVMMRLKMKPIGLNLVMERAQQNRIVTVMRMTFGGAEEEDGSEGE